MVQSMGNTYLGRYEVGLHSLPRLRKSSGLWGIRGYEAVKANQPSTRTISTRLAKPILNWYTAYQLDIRPCWIVACRPADQLRAGFRSIVSGIQGRVLRLRRHHSVGTHPSSRSLRRP